MPNTTRESKGTTKASKSTKATKATKVEEAKEEAPARIRAMDVQDKVLEAIKDAGKDGISLKDLVEVTGIRYRVLHNVTWKLEGSPEPKRDHPNYGVPRDPKGIKVERVHKGKAIYRAL